MANISKFNMNDKEIEVVDRTARDKAETNNENIEQVRADLTTETTRAEQAEQNNTDAIRTETSRAKAAEQANTTLIQNETSRAKGEESALDDKINTETARAQNKETELDSKINTNSDKISTNTRAISTETTARTTADNAINEKISSNEKITVNDVELVNENGLYTLSQTKNGTKTEVGTIDTNSKNNPVVEIKDTVVENNSDGYDFHTFTETTEDGTENNIGKMYLAQNQIRGIVWDDANKTLNVKSVGQDGVTHTDMINLPTSSGSSTSGTLNFNMSDNYYYITDPITIEPGRIATVAVPPSMFSDNCFITKCILHTSNYDTIIAIPTSTFILKSRDYINVYLLNVSSETQNITTSNYLIFSCTYITLK